GTGGGFPPGGISSSGGIGGGARAQASGGRARARERHPQDRLRVCRSGGARPPTQVIVAYIDGYRERFGVEPICVVLSEHGMKIAPPTYCARKAVPVAEAALAEACLVNALVTLWQQNWGVYGVGKLWHAARRAGIEVGRDQVG